MQSQEESPTLGAVYLEERRKNVRKVTATVGGKRAFSEDADDDAHATTI